MKATLTRVVTRLHQLIPWRRSVEMLHAVPVGGVALYAYEAPDRFVHAIWQKKKLQLLPRAARLPRRQKADYVVVIDRPLDEPGKATVVELATNHVPLIIGPKAKPADFFWELKSTFTARNGLWEIASSHDDFARRLDAMIATVQRRQHLPTREEKRWQALHAKLEELTSELRKKSFPEPIIAVRRRRRVTGIDPLRHGLHSFRGRLDAEIIRLLFGFTRAALARLLNVQPEALRKTPDAEPLQEKLWPYEQIAEMVKQHPSAKEFQRWLQTPETELENRAPRDVILTQGPDRVAAMVSARLAARASAAY